MAWSKDNSVAAKLAAAEALTQAQRAEEAVVNVGDAIAEVDAVVADNTTRFLPAVATVALRDSTYTAPLNGDTVRVTGTSTTYRYSTGSGWVVTDVYNATAIDNVTAQLAEKAQQTDLLLKANIADIGLRIKPYNQNGTTINKAKTTVVPFEVEDKMWVNRAVINITKNIAASLFEIAIYNSDFSLVTRSGVKETFLGVNDISLDNRELKTGRYYFAFACTSLSVEFVTVKTNQALSASYSLPLGASISSVFEEDTSIYFELYSYDLKVPTGFELAKMNGVRAFAKGGSTLYGWNTATGKVCTSASSGATWVDLMPINAGGCWAMEIDTINGIIYTMNGDGKIYKSSGMLASSTFTEITSPLKRTHAISLPSSMKLFGGYLWYGEYSSVVKGELEGGPKLLRYNLLTGEWKLSKQFANARHIHSFTEQGTSALFASLGDATWGTEIGLHRITPATIDEVNGDVWLKWTAFGSPYSSLYNIDSIMATLNGLPIILGACDHPGTLLTVTKISDTTAGSANLSSLCRSFKDSDSTETVKNVILDTRGNCYFKTGETTKPRLCVSPPPYTQAYILYDGFAQGETITMPVLSGEWIMFYDYRFKTVNFNTVAVTKNARKYIYNNKEVDSLTYGTLGAQGAKGFKNADNLYLEATSNIDAAVQYAGYYTTSKIDTTSYKRLVVELDGFDSYGTSRIRIKLSNDTVLSGNVSERIIDVPSKYSPFTTEIEIDLTSFQGQYHIHVMASATGVDAQTKLKVKNIYMSKNI